MDAPPASRRLLHLVPIKDDELATEAAEIETDHTLGPDDSRQRIADAITRRYTAQVAAGAALCGG